MNRRIKPDNTPRQIFFVTVTLHKAVHMQALGFTTQFYMYAYAALPAEAEQFVSTWVKAQGCELKAASAGNAAAVNQDPHSYTFPEQIINLPKDTLPAIYDRRRYPDSYRAPGRTVRSTAP